MKHVYTLDNLPKTFKFTDSRESGETIYTINITDKSNITWQDCGEQCNMTCPTQTAVDYLNDGTWTIINSSKENEMNKSVADSIETLKQSLAEAQENVKKLEAKLAEKKNESSSLLYEGAYCLFNNDSVGFYATDICEAGENNFNKYQTEEIAQHYAKAFNTFLQLRHQEGSEKLIDGEQQYIIDAEIEVDYFGGYDYKAHFLSPCFNSREAANKAIKNVGEENIRHMFNTFHGIYA